MGEKSREEAGEERVTGGEEPAGAGRSGLCEYCGEASEALELVRMDEFDLLVCAKCGKRLRERIRKKYLIAGEHTEPAE